jgi:NAD(P)-dependent dehydrogenase (short-subunit alcohol dehydrogenase family)
MTTNQPNSEPVAIVTGASRGLGRAITAALLARGWSVAIDARRADDLDDAAAALRSPRLVTVQGDVTDPAHRDALLAAAHQLGSLSLLVNNASRLGPSPQPALRHYPVDELAAVYAANVLAPVALTAAALPALTRASGAVVNVSSDAAVEAYEGWGGYGSAKAALDQISAVLAVEELGLAVYSFDPGDMRTEMHQNAFPDEDISDRPEPESVVPAFLRLIDARPPSGRYRAADLAPIAVSS